MASTIIILLLCTLHDTIVWSSSHVGRPFHLFRSDINTDEDIYINTSIDTLVVIHKMLSIVNFHNSIFKALQAPCITLSNWILLRAENRFNEKLIYKLYEYITKQKDYIEQKHSFHLLMIDSLYRFTMEICMKLHYFYPFKLPNYSASTAFTHVVHNRSFINPVINEHLIANVHAHIDFNSLIRK